MLTHWLPDLEAQKVLDTHGIDLVRAKYIKEIAVTTNRNQPIVFGDKSVQLGDIEYWLRLREQRLQKAAKNQFLWVKIGVGIGVLTLIVAIAAAVFAYLALPGASPGASH
jgi:hypothetical protein